MKKQITIDNYKNLTFTKIIYEHSAGPGDEKNKYDILMPIDDELSEESENSIYINELIYKMFTLPTINREQFIDYQISLYDNNSQQWLKEIDGMLNDYSEKINSYQNFLAEDFRAIIQQRVHFPTRLPELTWNFSDLDLFILTKALYLIKAIDTDKEHPANQNTIEMIFSKLFKIEEKAKDASRKLSSLKERKPGYIDFMQKLNEAWEKYRLEKTE